jgi:undecaprenyl diphosphate synthase
VANKLEHIAIIMDGNGRWAKAQGKERIEGHKRGAEVVREITLFASKNDIKYLTLYAFSTENWKRPKLEVDFLMRLLDKYLKDELPIYLENGVKFRVIGDTSRLSKKLQKRILDTEKATGDGDGLTQVLAINYGAKDEILRAVNKLIEAKKSVDEKSLENHLDTSGMPPVDMMIRTGGDKRLSNFLLWQNAYSEFFFTDTLWPDFNSNELMQMIEQFYNVQRRFGGI